MIPQPTSQSNELDISLANLPPPKPLSATHFQQFSISSTCPVLTVRIGQWKGPALIDSGSTRTIMSTQNMHTLGVPIQQCFNETAIGINGSVSFPCKAQVPIDILNYRLDDHLVFMS